MSAGVNAGFFIIMYLHRQLCRLLDMGMMSSNFPMSVHDHISGLAANRIAAMACFAPIPLLESQASGLLWDSVRGDWFDGHL